MNSSLASTQVCMPRAEYVRLRRLQALGWRDRRLVLGRRDDATAPARPSGPPLGRVTIDATPEVLQRIDRITDQVESTQRLVLGALGLGGLALAVVLLTQRRKRRAAAVAA